MKTPIDMMFDGAQWVAIENPQIDENLPFATHTGKLEIMGVEVVCYRLSNGQALIAPESMAALFGFDSVAEFEKNVLEVSRGEIDLEKRQIDFRL